MFKRLAKSKRHSAEGIVIGDDPRPSLRSSSPAPSLTGSTGSSASSVSCTFEGRNVSDPRICRGPRSKQARRSCGDQPLQSVTQQQPRLGDDHQPRRTTEVDAVETDYQMVTAVPAYIVEHEPEKQQKGLGVWGRRMSKKIDSFRRSSCRDPPLLPAEKLDNFDRQKILLQESRKSSPQQRSASPFKSFFIRMGSTGMLNSAKANRRSRNAEQIQAGDQRRDISATPTTRVVLGRCSRTPEKDLALFRSCSTSQLNTSTTYVKGDDPSEGIDLRINGKDKTVSCDDLAGQDLEEDDDDDDVFESVRYPEKLASPSPSPSASSVCSRIFHPIDFNDSRIGNENPVRKSVSCEFREFRDESKSPKETSKDAKRLNFPYAFLRSKLSVLPEERHSCGINGTNAVSSVVVGPGPVFSHQKQKPDERLFKTVSEEHFPTLTSRVDDSSFEDGTTTLGRRRSRPQGSSSLAALRVGSRNSYSEYRTAVYEQREKRDAGGQDRFEFPSSGTGTTGTTGDYADLEPPSALLRAGPRRNSAPSAEQRLSSHYVSSNESGYDSDGPRGESAGASEAEAFGSNRADSSDTSSVVDSEMEKPTRSSTPSEYPDQTDHHHQYHHSQQSCNNLRKRYQNYPKNSSQQSGVLFEVRSRSKVNRNEDSNEDPVEGLRWHQTTSGRLLPSINQTNPRRSTTTTTTSSGIDISEDSEKDEFGSICASPHRMRLQQDKRRFLSDIIQPPSETVRRSRIVKLTKNDPGESLGIRLAQQRAGTIRYVVVELENKGIAHRDGRLRLGDEIVEVEGRELGTLDSLQAVQNFLASFKGNEVRLLTAYEESIPQVCGEPTEQSRVDSSSSSDTSSQDNQTPTNRTLPGENEYFENAKNLSNMSLEEDREPGGRSRRDAAMFSHTRFSERDESNARGHLSLSTASINDQNEQKDRDSSIDLGISEGSTEGILDAHRYSTRHVARFEKGYGRPSLGFSVVGGRDSPRGEMGIFVRRVFPGGQAEVSKSLLQGDEILTLNGKILRGFTHREVIELFKAVREGVVELEIVRRHRYPNKTNSKSVSY